MMIVLIVLLSYAANAQQDTANRKSDPVNIQLEMDKQNEIDENNNMNQNQNRKSPGTMKDTIMQHHMKSDHMMMQRGKMVMMKDGKIMAIEKDMTFKNGTICMTDGKCKMKDGTSMMMMEGDMMDMDGKLLPEKKIIVK